MNVGIPRSASGQEGETMRSNAHLIASGAVVIRMTAGASSGKVEGDTVALGAAVSLTGRHSVDGKSTKDGYDVAVKRINEMAGVKVGGKSYKRKVLYYEDDSTPAS